MSVCFGGLFAVAALTIVVGITVCQRLSLLYSPEGWRVELAVGETHTLEDLAHVLVVGQTLLVGDGKLVGGNDYLAWTHYADNREYTEGDKTNLVALGIDELSAHAGADVVGDGVHAAAAAAVMMALVHKLRLQDKRIDDFHDGSGEIAVCSVLVEVGQAAEIVAGRVGLEDIYVPFASKKNDLLVVYRNALDLLRFAHAYADVKHALEEKSYINLVKTAVKGNRVDCNVRPQYLAAFGANARGTVHNILTAIRQKQP